ncbi:DUF4268 domain-containing protein [Lewinella sp. LCG006]|uniref:DUF4268 domain-containing protein n=1 Tax=Lewinella sp. LCG006 TaxID=3231911 RepID=UPI00345F9BC5
MYSREQATQIRKSFWTTFGQYMRPIPSADGLKVNWINYKTGFKGLNFSLDVDKEKAYIGIVLNQKDPDLRSLFYEQLLELKGLLHTHMGEEWSWEEVATNAQYQEISQVYTLLPGVSLFHQEDWPAIISFFKTRLIALDEFWSMGKFHFEPLKF